MAGIRIVTDSGCDLPAKLVEELGIEVVPLTVRFGTDEFRDLTPAEFWTRLAASSMLPETAAPSPGAFEEAFRRAASAGADGVVCVTLSGGLSATYQSAVVAAQSVAADIPVRVIDSRNVTIAEGLMAVAAARLAQQGKDLDDCAGAAEDLVGRTKVFGALDTLENLKKGGRIGAAQAFFGSMLSIKPIIQVVDGKVEPESKQRTRSKSLRYLVDKVRDAGQIEDLAVMNGDAPDVDELLDMLGAVYPRDQIIVGDVGPVIGTHSGPRVVGVSFHIPR